jgi:hypothetical protein
MLRLLLDEHISPEVAEGLLRHNPSVTVFSMMEWQAGSFLGQDDTVILQAAAEQHLTLVTYDQRTIPDILQKWADDGSQHSGVIFVDHKTIASADFGGLIRALNRVLTDYSHWDWANRVHFLRRSD